MDMDTTTLGDLKVHLENDQDDVADFIERELNALFDRENEERNTMDDRRTRRKSGRPPAGLCWLQAKPTTNAM